jgi:DNA polymerase III delta subunit
MARIIFHGPHHLKSREAYSRALDQAKISGIKDIVILDKKNISENVLIQSLESPSLFGTSRLITLDNVFAHPSKSLTNKVINLLQTSPAPNIHVWYSKELNASQQKKLSSFDMRFFKVSPAIFKFLELYSPHKPQQYLKAFNDACDQNSPELVFHLLARHLRDLLSLDNFKGAPWKKAKLANQFNQIGQANLVCIHHRLYSLDYRLKSGQLILPYQQELLRVLLVTP